jgi:tetratricopeptide (TPR) repeat protein
MEDRPTPFQKSLRRYVVIGVLATLLLLGLKLLFEHTSWGHENQLWMFGKLQGSLPSIDLDNPVVVLDISQLPGGKINDPTPRASLKAIISALADLQPQPRAIGVDINFSPKGPNPSTEDDEDFFDFCLAIRNEKRVPVFLAIAETKAAPPEAWLGNEAYEELAVAAPGEKNDTSRIPLLVKSPNSPRALKTLNYALALEYRKTLARPHPWIGWAVETNVELADTPFQQETPIEEDATIKYEERLVNFSKLNQLRVAAHADLDALAITRSADKYSNKLVILGDLGSDVVYVPGYGLYPGSLVLASATYTLIKEPLFEFKWWMRLLLDLVIAGLIIAAISVIRRRTTDGSWKQWLLIAAGVFLVWVAGWGLVRWAGVLWLDFLLVALALLLHPKTEHLIDKGLERFSKITSPESASPPTPPQAVAPITQETKNTVGGLLLLMLVASGQASAQQRLVPAGCEKTVAAVGVRLTMAKQQSKSKPAATCYVRENKRSEWLALTIKDEKRQYRAGNHLYCDADCSVTLLYCGTSTEHLVNTQKPHWFAVIHAYRPVPLFDEKSDNLLRLSRTFSPPDPTVGDEYRFPGEAAKVRSVNRPGGRSAQRVVGDRGGIGDRIGVGDRDGVGDRGKVYRSRSSPSGARTSSGASSTSRPTSTAAAGTPTGNDAPANILDFGPVLIYANAARRQGDYVTARQLYLEAQKKDAKDYRVFQGLGNLYADQKDWSAAEQAYREGLKLQPRDSALTLSLAFVMLESIIAGGDRYRLQEVEEILLLVSTESPSNERVYDLFEQFFAFQNTQPREMAPVYERGVSYIPDSVKMNLRYAEVLYRLDRPREALKFVRAAEENAIDEELLWVAGVYESRARYKDAERALRSAAEWMPDEPAVLYKLGSVLIERKRYEQALQMTQRAVRLEPGAFAPVLLSGIAQLRQGDLAGAEISFDNAARNLPKDTDAPQRLAYWFSILGDEYRSKGKFSEAIGAYEKSLTHNRDDPDTRDRLLEAQRRHNNP